MAKFKIISDKIPRGDQPKAIKQLVEGYKKNSRQTLLGITGSGKTFTMANVIKELGIPTLVLAHNKTLAFQLYTEIKELFPENRVEYFISYFDYYQPESYIPQSDTYIAKDSKTNSQIEVMRLRATASLLTREDVIIVSSISCIYGIGSPSDWKNMAIHVKINESLKRSDFFRRMVSLQYERNDIALEPGRFRVKGNTVDIIPGYDKNIRRVMFLGDRIIRMQELDPVTGSKISELKNLSLFPSRHYVVPEERIKSAVDSIRKELRLEAPKLPELEQQRLIQRTNYDIEMIEEVGYCNGIENYSNHFENRPPEKPPFCLLDFFPKDFLFIIDESHQSIPQSRAMYHGDRSRKKNLVDHGFRLPSAYGNRPLKFEEFEQYFNHVVFVSATPADYELNSSTQIVEQIIRPTGLLDPAVEIKPIKGQVDDLIAEIRAVIKNKRRILVTTLTKRMAEDLTEYLSDAGIKVRYLHSEIDSLQRNEIIRELRLGEFDVLVGINLLREGLDIPEVSLVAILDADKEGFLRDERSLIQTIGRGARNDKGRVILYADTITKSIRRAVKTTRERRERQNAHNKKHGITPTTVYKTVGESNSIVTTTKHLAKKDYEKMIAKHESGMYAAAERLDFERALELRNLVKKLKSNKK